MKCLKPNRLMRLCLTSLLLLVVSAGAHDGGTTPGTDIDNQATLDYKVGGTDQPAVTSDGDTGTPGNQVTTFKVDRKVDLAVDSNGGLTVIPNSDDQVLPFTLTNTGNDTHGYLLSTVAGLDATDDDFDMNSVRIFIDIGIVGTYEPGTDLPYTPGDNVGDLAVDASSICWSWQIRRELRLIRKPLCITCWHRPPMQAQRLQRPRQPEQMTQRLLILPLQRQPAAQAPVPMMRRMANTRLPVSIPYSLHPCSSPRPRK